MRRFSTLVLLIAAVLAPIVSGRPVYHCTLTGIDSIFCGCPQEQVASGYPSCCATKPCERGETPESHLACSDCCEITFHRCVATKPETKTELQADFAAPVADGFAALAPAAPIRCDVFETGTGPGDRVPAYVRNVSFLC